MFSQYDRDNTDPLSEGIPPAAGGKAAADDTGKDRGYRRAVRISGYELFRESVPFLMGLRTGAVQSAPAGKKRIAISNDRNEPLKKEKEIHCQKKQVDKWWKSFIILLYRNSSKYNCFYRELFYRKIFFL